MSTVSLCEWCGDEFVDSEEGEVFLECEWCGDMFCTDMCLTAHEEEEHGEDIEDEMGKTA